jgi:restriction system protein
MNQSPSTGLATVPTFSKLMFPCLRALKALGGSGTNDEILEKLVEIEKIPEDVQKIQHTDHTQSALSYRLAWAKTYLKNVGALENSGRGVWAITDKGRAMSEKDCLGVAAQVRKANYEKRKAAQDFLGGDSAEADEAESEAPSWKDQLLTVLKKLKSDAFERLSQRLLRKRVLRKSRCSESRATGALTASVSFA